MLSKIALSHHQVHFLGILPSQRITSRQQNSAFCTFQTQVCNLPHAPMIWVLFWRLIPLNGPLFVVFSAWFLVSPKILHTRYISEEKRPITSDSRFTPSLPSDSTLLLPSQLYSSLRVFLCPGFSTESKTADPPYLRVITHRITFGSALWTGQTEECRSRPDTRKLLSQTSSRTCASLPSRPCATSHWDPIQLSRWDGGVSSAPSYGLNISHISPPPSQEPHFPFKCQNLKYNVCK